MRGTIVAALLMVSPLSFASSASAGAMTYLSLGDSLAFGETDFQHNPSAGDRGFVKAYDQFLAGQNGGIAPRIVNLAIDGDTSSSFLSGSGRVPPASGISDANLASYNSRYAANPNVSQNLKMVQAIINQWSQGNTIGHVTISLGSNDLFALAGQPGFLTSSPAVQQAGLAQALSTFSTNYGNLLGEVKGLLPNASVTLLGTYNPFAATPNSPYAAFGAPAIQALNATIQGLAKQNGANYADTYTPFVGHESQYTYITTIPGNVHPNAAGYAAIASAVEAVPEPSTLAALGFGIAALAVRARRRRARA